LTTTGTRTAPLPASGQLDETSIFEHQHR